MKLDKFKKILLVLGVVFFFVYAWPTLTVTWPAMRVHQGYYISSWPDSMANYFFAGQLAQNNSLSYDEPLNLLADDFVQPRSVNVFNHHIVPTGFLGFILICGVLAKLIGLYAVLLITPLLMVLAVWAFYGLVKRLYDERVALIGALLLFILPPVWYYASLPMLSNVLFLSLVIIAYYFYFKQTEQKKYWLSLITGLLFGLALIIRPMEFVWVGILLGVPVLVNREHFKLKRALVLVAGVLVSIIILLMVNQKLYNNAFYTGYLNLESSKGDSVITRLPPALATNLSAGLAYPKLILAPFGIHPRLILHNLNNYFVKLLWPWCLLLLGTLILGVRQFKKNKLSQAQKVYAWLALLVGLILVVYYGSWLLDDKLTLRLNTIGISYVRYWLPLYVLLLPVMAWGLERGTRIFKSAVIRVIILAVIYLLLLIFSYRVVYLNTGDGLRDQAQVTINNYQLLDAVKAQVNKEAVIITDREDKILFPEYSVVMFFNNDYRIFAPLKKIIGVRPIYYLTQSGSNTLAEINTRLSELGLKLTKSVRVDDRFILYKLESSH